MEQDQVATITIEGKEIERLEYRRQPVITLRMIDELHERPEGTARRSFNEHKTRFITREDYFRVPYEEWSQINAVRNAYGDAEIRQRNPITLLTQSGYLLLVKTFSDERAWQVQRSLVKCYFAMRELPAVVKATMDLLQSQVQAMQSELRLIGETTAGQAEEIATVRREASERSEELVKVAALANAQSRALLSIQASTERLDKEMGKLRDIVDIDIPVRTLAHPAGKVRFFLIDYKLMVLGHDFVTIQGRPGYSGATQKLMTMGFSRHLDLVNKTAAELSLMYGVAPGSVMIKAGLSTNVKNLAFITPSGMEQVYRLNPDFHRWCLEKAAPCFAELYAAHLRLQHREANASNG